MLNVYQLFTEMGPESALLVFIGPILVAALCIMASRALWFGALPHGFGHFLAGIAIAIGTVALAAWISFYALVLVTGIGGYLHLSQPLLRLISSVILTLSAIFSFMIVRSPVANKRGAGNLGDIIP